MMVTNRGARIVLVALEALMGVAAVGGGLDLVLTNGQTIRMPAELLEGSPFGSFFIPGLVLLVVGIVKLTSAVVVLRRHRWGAPASVVVGIIWIGWFVVQVAVVGFLNWQQPVYFVVGLLIIVLAAPALIGEYRMSNS
jgi:uncharacterized membrane protein